MTPARYSKHKHLSIMTKHVGKKPAHKTHKKAKKGKGFTIVEVLIVLAIAGMIMVALFMLVPTVTRNSRNNTRKTVATFTASQLDAYKTNNNGLYPTTPAQMCTFITEYLKTQIGNASCNPVYVASADCVRVTGDKNISFCFHDAQNSPHSYIGAHDEISIQMGHWCNDNPSASGEPATTPITSYAPYIHPRGVYVVWTKLEPNAVACYDNYQLNN